VWRHWRVPWHADPPSGGTSRWVLPGMLTRHARSAFHLGHLSGRHSSLFVVPAGAGICQCRLHQEKMGLLVCAVAGQRAVVADNTAPVCARWCCWSFAHCAAGTLLSLCWSLNWSCAAHKVLTPMCVELLLLCLCQVLHRVAASCQHISSFDTDAP
jgi:hypothetical protein